MPYRVYILLCSDGPYYTGSTSDLERRFQQHQEGVNPDAYTYSRRPVKLLWFSEEVPRYADALAFEHQVKGWSRRKKEALMRGDFNAIHEIVKQERKEREKRASKRIISQNDHTQ